MWKVAGAALKGQIFWGRQEVSEGKAHGVPVCVCVCVWEPHSMTPCVPGANTRQLSLTPTGAELLAEM